MEKKVYEFKDIPFDAVVSEDASFIIIGVLTSAVYNEHPISLSELLLHVHDSIIKNPYKNVTVIDEIPF